MSESIEELEGDADFLDDLREWSVLFDSDQVSKCQQNDNEKKKNTKQNKNDNAEQISAITLQTNVDAKNGPNDKGTSDYARSTKSSSSKTNLFEEMNQDLMAVGAENKKNLTQRNPIDKTGISDQMTVASKTDNENVFTDPASVPSLSKIACSPQIISGKKHKLQTNEPDNSKLRKIENNSDVAKTLDKGRTKVTLVLQSEDTKEKEVAKNTFEENSLEQISHVKKAENTLSKKKTDNISSSELSKIPVFSEVECRNIDNVLVEEMMEDLKQQLISHQGDKYFIRFSPVELADLADTSVQDLIHSQPNLTFYFKRQGKFKKKKGYAESYFSQSQEVQSFLQKFLLVKLVENKVDVTITYLHCNKEPELLSFTALLDKNSQLIKLVKNLEDPAKSKIDAKGFFEVENVPFGATALMLKTLFPFSKSIQLPSDKSVNKEQCFKGATKIFLTNESWIEAVTSCCSDFKYKSKSLTVLHKNSRIKPEPEVKKETVFENKKESDYDSKKDVNVSNSSDKTDNSLLTNDVKNAQINVLSPSFPVESPQDLDADISSMTLDVCTGMLESLNKLKKLGTDNPNVLKILEMQSQIASLQQSLSQSIKSSPSDHISDPWSVGPSDKLSKKDRKKLDEEKRLMKQIKEMEDLQKMIEDADEVERQKEENVRRQRELEQQKLKSADDKSKLSWARKMIEEAKMTGGSLSGESSATKQEAQRMLKAREERLKEEEEAKKREELKKKSVTNTVQESKVENGSNALSKEQEAQTLKDADVITSKADDKDTTKTTKVEDKDPEVSTGANPSRSPQDEENTIYSEVDYNQMAASNTLHMLPANYFIQLSYFNNRQCPVHGCPATKFFKTAPSFIDHWEIFHRPNVTMRFCSKCSAYFMNNSELESHLLKRHSFTDAKVVSKLVQEARVKIVSNPSYRDPGQFLGPVE
ncbi:hypothetical protein Btru_067483 [Bulinus truncatus]|nr:hypothetical protein Btru_067483 [Bulinus truncatus]